jgi:general stress protein 26
MSNEVRSFKKILDYIDDHPLVVIGTTNEDSTPHGSVVYMTPFKDNDKLYFITKTGTTKYHNIIDNPTVSITAFDEQRTSTVQAQGVAHVYKNIEKLGEIMKRISAAEESLPEWMPPIAKLKSGAYVVFEVTLTIARLAEFKGRKFGSENIFSEA